MVGKISSEDQSLSLSPNSQAVDLPVGTFGALEDPPFAESSWIPDPGGQPEQNGSKAGASRAINSKKSASKTGSKILSPVLHLSGIQNDHGEEQKENPSISQTDMLSNISEIELDPKYISHRNPIVIDDTVVAVGLDCETNSFKGPILELAAMNYNTGEVWQTLINPGDIVFSPQAYKIHKISQKMVQADGVPTSKEACRQFLAWLHNQAQGQQLVIMGYNLIK